MDRLIYQKILQTLQIAYAIAEPDLRVVEIGGASSLLTGDRFVGQTLPDLIPELQGCESPLHDVLTGKLPLFRLEQINRDDATVRGAVRYLTLTVRLLEPERPRLLAVLTDTTAQGRYMQMLTQQRNELALLQRDLVQIHGQLDFLLRHYVPTQVADALLERRLLPRPGGELRQVSVLFADLRGYSRWAGQLSPQQTMQLVNRHLTVACDAIAEVGGTITQFMADAVMALFNAPGDQPDHAWRAVRAGVTLQRRMKSYRVGDGLPRLDFGVGIHSGPAVVGNTGAHWRYAYSAIGDTTNTAFRICGIAQAGEVLIGSTTRQQVADRVTVTALSPIRLKGKSKLLPIFRVEDMKGSA